MIKIFKIIVFCMRVLIDDFIKMLSFKDLGSRILIIRILLIFNLRMVVILLVILGVFVVDFGYKLFSVL